MSDYTSSLPFGAAVLASALAIGAPIAAHAAPAVSDSDTAQARAKIVTPIAIVNTQSLEFGTVIQDGSIDGTMTVHASGAVPTYASVYDGAGPDSPHPAKFTVYGYYGWFYSIELPPGSILLDDGNGNTLEVSDFNVTTPDVAVSLPLVDVALYGFAPAVGLTTDEFQVGATLSVPAATPPGSYAGTFDVTVNKE